MSLGEAADDGGKKLRAPKSRFLTKEFVIMDVLLFPFVPMKDSNFCRKAEEKVKFSRAKQKAGSGSSAVHFGPSEGFYLQT